jgi:hypothetical protein
MIVNAHIALKIHRKALAAGAMPPTPLGELMALPQTLLPAGEPPASFVQFKHWLNIKCKIHSPNASTTVYGEPNN